MTTTLEVTEALVPGAAGDTVIITTGPLGEEAIITKVEEEVVATHQQQTGDRIGHLINLVREVTFALLTIATQYRMNILMFKWYRSQIRLQS